MFVRLITLMLFLPAVAAAESTRNWVMISADLHSSFHEYYCAMEVETVQAIAEGRYSKPFVQGKDCYFYDNAMNLKPFSEAGYDNGRFGWDGNVWMRVDTIQRIINVDNAFTEARWEQKLLISPRKPSLNR